MADFLTFTLQALVIFVLVVGSLAGLILLIAALAAKSKLRPELQVESWNEKLEARADEIRRHLMSDKEWKHHLSETKTKHKDRQKEGVRSHRIYVLDFDGDRNASATTHLREEVTAILSTASAPDEVVVRLFSPGGLVHAYGHASSQLLRLRDAGLQLTICVDEIAASGGYMMAVVGQKILAAPFAILGSVGVIAEVPNFHRVLKKYDVDFQEFTAGEYKRTVSLLGEPTAKGAEKFQEQLETTLRWFKHWLSQNRKQLDVQRIATGEIWLGTEAKELGLIDEISTSDAYLLQRAREGAEVLSLKFQTKQTLMEKMMSRGAAQLGRSLERFWSRLQSQQLP